MTAAEMLYDFKVKLNKLDSSNNKNLRVPEIDWILNEAQTLFIKMVAEPRYKQLIGFETSQRTTEDIRTLVVSKDIIPTDNVISLPADYLFFIKGKISASNGNCSITNGRLLIKRHTYQFEDSPFDKSSFIWKEFNGVFNSNGILLYPDSGTTINLCKLTYIKTPAVINNSPSASGGSYTNLEGVVLTVAQDCELPAETHSEIVDLAVLLAIGDIRDDDMQSKLLKLNLTNLK